MGRIQSMAISFGTYGKYNYFKFLLVHNWQYTQIYLRVTIYLVAYVYHYMYVGEYISVTVVYDGMHGWQASGLKK